MICVIGYEPADLTVHPPPPRTAEDDNDNDNEMILLRHKLIKIMH